MSSKNHNLNVDTEDALEFPNSLPPGTQVNVPFPSDSYPNWTTHPYNGVDIPPTFDNLIQLPNARDEPALYAAAVDTIRMTNTYFELVGPYSRERPLTAKHVQKKQQQWPSVTDKHSNVVTLSPLENYPRPPDLRTLFVKENMGNPTDDKQNALWLQACRDLQAMSSDAKEDYLQCTRNMLIEQAKSRPGEDDKRNSWLILEIFKRYLVWREFRLGSDSGETEEEKTEDEQPTWSDMEAFFNRTSVKKDGATLVDICHTFPYARNMQMLVYRIEHFATLTRQASVKTKAGVDDPVESRYMRKLNPTVAGVKLVVTNLLKKSGTSASVSELAARYWPSTDNRKLIADVLNTVARPDVTTGRFILMTHAGPSRKEIDDKVEEENYINGFTLAEIAGRFPNRVWSLDRLRHSMSNFTYFDNDEQRYFPLYELEESNARMERGNSVAYRNRARINLAFDPETIQQHYIWNRSTMRYVPSPERLQLGDITEVETQPAEPYSPTEIASTIGGSLPPEPTNTLQSGVIAAVETTPIDPPNASAAPPVEEPAAGNETTPAGSPPPTAGAKKAGRSRPPKRAATEPVEPTRDTKKPRKVLKIQCSRVTQKGTRCKRKKGRVEGEEEWDCNGHKQS